MNPTFQTDDSRPGLTVIDPVQNKQYPLKTPEPVGPQRCEPDGFYFPVDSAVEFSTERLLLPYVVPVCIRNVNGEMVAEAQHYAYETLPDAEYILELTAPIRLYVHVCGEVMIASSDDRMEFDFGDRTHVRLGARSHHDQPAGTVETTAKPMDLARAVSTFGSALKTNSCERSLPSLRGHPPRIELGDDVRIPDPLTPPETGVEITVPPNLTAVFTATPLAYYLGATVRTGETPRIETDRGFKYQLGDTNAGFEEAVERVLAQVFFFDCVTRTEGIYEINLVQRARLEERIGLATDKLYNEPLAEQLATYLSIPFDTVSDLLPQWQLVTHATAEPGNIAALPFLADELSFIRAAPDTNQSAIGEPSTHIGLDDFPRSGSRSGDDVHHQPTVDSFVSPPNVDAFEQAWLGEGTPIGANKLLQAGFEHGLERSPSTEGVEITIVCNDDQMVTELDDGLYGDRDELPFDVTVRRNLGVEGLRSTLAQSRDFLHYVGHVENSAFVCRDGTLEADSLENIGVETFLINGCQSYEIGAKLVQAGSVGGIVTLSDVGNDDAVAVGRLIARLLNTGFTLRSAVSMARSDRLVGNQYVVIGDGGAAVAQSGGGVPNRCRVEQVAPNRYQVQQYLYHSQDGIGGLYIPYIDGIDQYFLVGCGLPLFELSGQELYRFFQLEEIPVEFNGTVRWSSDAYFESL